MKAHFDQVALDAQKLKSDGEVRLFVVSSVRLLLHQAVFSLLEWACKQPSRENTYLPSDLFPGLLVPADGTLVDSLESLVIYCEQVGLDWDLACSFRANSGRSGMQGHLWR